MPRPTRLASSLIVAGICAAALSVARLRAVNSSKRVAPIEPSADLNERRVQASREIA